MNGKLISRSSHSRLLMRSMVVVACAVAVTVTAASCQLVNSPTVQTGTISGQAWGSAWDPAPPANTVIGRAILTISPSVGGNKYIVTDKYGMFTLKNVPVGDYAITPIDIVNPKSTAVTVADGKTASVSIDIPSGQVAYYYVNTTLSSPPLSTTAVRDALSEAIDRKGFVSSIPVTGFSAATNFIPPSLDAGSWAATAKSLTYSLADANTALDAATSSSFALTILANDKGPNVSVANAVATDLGKLNRVTSVTVNIQPWNTVFNDLKAGSFQISRPGWALDTNNLIDMFDFVFHNNDYGSYPISKLQPLIDQGNTALDNDDIAGYHKAVIAINDLLVADSPLIPLYSK